MTVAIGDVAVAVGDMTFTIREAEPGDRPALVELWVAAWQAAMPAIDFEARRAWLAHHLDSLTRQGAKLLTACDEAGVAGFITVDPVTGELDQLAVANGRQGRGLARALIGAAKEASPGGLHLAVNTANARAVDLYKRAGFVVLGEGTNERSGLPVYRMAWHP